MHTLRPDIQDQAQRHEVLFRSMPSSCAQVEGLRHRCFLHSPRRKCQLGRDRKAALDTHVASSGEKLDHWGYHDLRRTVRTHMSRLNVSSGVAERVINHTPQGVEAIYDRHGYLEEKRKALETWSSLIFIGPIQMVSPSTMRASPVRSSASARTEKTMRTNRTMERNIPQS